MGTCTIGLAEGRHVDALVALFEAQLQEHSIETSQDNLRAVIEAVIADRRYGFILAATVPDGRVVGAAYASSLLSFEHGGISGWLEELYVLPQWRDQGLCGTSLAYRAGRAPPRTICRRLIARQDVTISGPRRRRS